MSIMVNYAQLALKCGVNIQKGQTLVITGPIWTADFAHLVMEEAFRLGAKDVIIHYDDPEADRLRLKYADEETLRDVPRWMAECQTVYGDRGAVFMRLSSAKPGMMDGVDSEKMSIRQRALNAPVMDLKLKRMANDLSWTAVAVPNEAWAQQVYPELEPQAALDALWQAVYDCCYVTKESATDGWNAHMDDMQRTVKKLNAMKPRRIHLKNSLGTDLRVKLADFL